MNLIVTLMVSFCGLIGGALNASPVYLATLGIQPATVQQASAPVTTDAPPEQQVTVSEDPPANFEEPVGSWSIAGEVSVGEYALPYSIEGYLKASEAEPVLGKITIGDEGLGLSIELPQVIKDLINEYDGGIQVILQMAAKFKLQGIGLKFCIDILCVTAEINAEGSYFERQYTTPPSEPLPPPMASP